MQEKTTCLVASNQIQITYNNNKIKKNLQTNEFHEFGIHFLYFDNSSEQKEKIASIKS